MPEQSPSVDPIGSGDSDLTGKSGTKRSRKKLIVIVLLSLALAAALGVLAFYLVKLHEANLRIEKQEQQIEDQQDLINKKETFDTEMQRLLATSTKFDGVRMTSIVPFEDYVELAEQAWTDREESIQLDRDIVTARQAEDDLDSLLSGAATELASNTTGTAFETTIDSLGGGFVRSLLENADSVCETDVVACVISDDPYTVHFDAADNAEPYMTDWIRTGAAYHEFAHVLQMTNPIPTETALAAFGGDDETMADCFALTYLSGWKLHQRVWTSRYEYWDVDLGYGLTCSAAQKQVIRDWYEELGFHAQPISQ